MIESKRDERNELIRKILQVCGACSHGQGKGRGLICDRKRSQCHSKQVRKWLKEIERLEKLKPSGKRASRRNKNSGGE